MQNSKVKAVLADLVENKAIVSETISEEGYRALETQLNEMIQLADDCEDNRIISTSIATTVNGVTILIEMIRKSIDIQDPTAQIEYLIENPAVNNTIIHTLEEQIKVLKEDAPKEYAKYSDRVWNLLEDLKDSFVNIGVNSPNEVFRIQSEIYTQLGWKNVA